MSNSASTSNRIDKNCYYTTDTSIFILNSYVNNSDQWEDKTPLILQRNSTIRIIMRSNPIVILALLLVHDAFARHRGKNRTRVYTLGKTKKRVYTKHSKNDDVREYDYDAIGLDLDEIHQTDPTSPFASKCIVSTDEGYKSLGCDEDEYCHISYGKCNRIHDDEPLHGICREVIHRCTREFKPVCGCDKTTYANICVSLSKGVSVKHIRSCLQ